MISFEEARNIILSHSETMGLEERDILRCNGMVLGEDVYSSENLPPFNKSAMDGYAINRGDIENLCEGTETELQIEDVIKTGDWSKKTLKQGQAFKVMTGAALPEGVDCVIEVEKAREENDKVYINKKVKRGTNVIKCGEELQKGQRALKKGHIIRPAEIGILASLGYSRIRVYRRPEVILLITGDELTGIDSKPVQGKIRGSNEYSLIASVEGLGARAVSFGIVKDDKAALHEKIELALSEGDIVITSGGVSAGDYDFVWEVLNSIGADIKFYKVAIKPGKPVIFAVHNGKLFFGLPGNPMSAITTFEELVKPAIKKIIGRGNFCNEEFGVILADRFTSKTGRRDFIYVDLKKENGSYYAHGLGRQSSSQLMSVSRANGVVIIPEEIEEVGPGEVLNGRFIFA